MKALVTGGAGFIGSNLVDALVARGDEVRVLDDISTGFRENVPDAAEFVEGDIRDPDAVDRAVQGCEVIFHEAAHRAVFRSVEHPLATDEANTRGTLHVLDSARNAGVRRVVIASSSSVYGGADITPTPESAPLRPRSPYAVSKLAAEQYTRVFAGLYDIETVALRYFNVFGPRQRPDSQYAAVIPLFIDALRNGRPPTVHGDGKQSRDFTYIDDTVAANLVAADAPAERASGGIYNVACGRQYSLLDLLAVLSRIIGVEIEPEFTDSRPGDVRNTCADISAARRDLGYEPRVSFEEGLERTVAWFSQR
ncbi:MAG: SDR family oxidoreductase [Acidimicrobiia bacterium]